MMIRDTMRWSEVSHDHSSAPTIKNHSVTHFNGYLFCFGGYDGRRNHMTLLLYSIAEQRWIRPHHQPHPLEGGGGGMMINANGSGGNGGSNGSLSSNNPNNSNNGSNNNNNNNNNNNGGNHQAVGGDYHLAGDPTIVVQGTPPPGRNGHSATLAVDDEENAKIVIIGGWLGTGPLAASDMHILDVSAGGRQLRWYQPPIKGTPPGPCNMHSADYVAHRREVYVFRGGNGREYLNDLHALHVDTLTWRRVETNGQAPQPRANHSSAMLEETAELCLFGGWNGGERLNDIHILDTVTSTWTCPRVGGVLPHPRAGMTLTALRGRLMLFGGSGTSAKCFNDLQILDRQEMIWLDVTQCDPNSENNNGNPIKSHHEYDADDSPPFRFGGGDYYSNRNAQFSGNQDDGMYDHDDPREPPPPHHHHDGYGSRTVSNGNSGGGVVAVPAHAHGSSTDWRSRDIAGQIRHATASVRSMHVSPNPNDEDTVPTVLVYGKGPGRRAGHTATAVNRKIYIFGGSCGSDYLSDFFVLDTDPPPRAIVSEPTTHQLLERRLCHFFNDEEFSDVTFLVQGQKVFGHKMVLSIVSDCFRAMFTTGFRESQAMEIEIPDCSHAAFLSVMEYIYSGTLPKSLTTITTTPHALQDERQLDRIVEMLELADRFFLDHLKQVCESLLQAAVTPDTVEYLLSMAQKTNALQLQAICEHFVRNRHDVGGPT